MIFRRVGFLYTGVHMVSIKEFEGVCLGLVSPRIPLTTYIGKYLRIERDYPAGEPIAYIVTGGLPSKELLDEIREISFVFTDPTFEDDPLVRALAFRASEDLLKLLGRKGVYIPSPLLKIFGYIYANEFKKFLEKELDGRLVPAYVFDIGSNKVGFGWVLEKLVPEEGFRPVAVVPPIEMELVVENVAKDAFREALKYLKEIEEELHWATQTPYSLSRVLEELRPELERELVLRTKKFCKLRPEEITEMAIGTKPAFADVRDIFEKIMKETRKLPV